jgi:hypothetical protein
MYYKEEVAMNKSSDNEYALAYLSEIGSVFNADGTKQYLETIKKRSAKQAVKTFLVHRTDKVLHFFEGSHQQIEALASLIASDRNSTVLAMHNFSPSPNILQPSEFQVIDANRSGFEGEASLEFFFDNPDPQILFNMHPIRLRRLIFRLKSESAFRSISEESLQLA